MPGNRKSTNARICECGAMCFAPVSSWGVIFVDAEDAKFLREYVWSQNASHSYTQYAVSPTFARQNDTSRYLHLAVLGIQQNVAHLNRNGLDNHRANLRLYTETESSQYRRKKKSNLHRGRNLRSSHYKGVHKYGRKWMAYMTVEGKKIWLGRFGFESDAAICYNYHAAHYFGDFAGPNDLTRIEYMYD